MITAGQAKLFSAKICLALAQWSTACPLRAEATWASSDFRVAQSMAALGRQAAWISSFVLEPKSSTISHVRREHLHFNDNCKRASHSSGELKLQWRKAKWPNGLSGRASALSQTMTKKIRKRWMIVRRRRVRKAVFYCLNLMAFPATSCWGGVPSPCTREAIRSWHPKDRPVAKRFMPPFR